MKDRFKILHLITRLELGGAQQNTLYCTRHHDRARFDVHLIAGSGGMLDSEARSIPDARVTLMPELRHPISPWADLRALLRLRRYFVEEQIDLVHTHSSKAGVLGRWAAALAGVPVVVHTVHGWSFNDSQPGWLRRLYVGLERFTARRTDRLFVVSAINREDGLAAGIGRAEQYEVVHSGIDREAFARPRRAAGELRHELGFTEDEIVVGTIACLKPQKAPLDLVAAAAIACREDDRLRFFVAGDGDLRREVEQAISRAQLQDRVKLLGWRDDVAELLHAADLFLLTSRFEGLPRSVLQAMAAGTPVIATAVDGTPEVVEQDVTGKLIEPGRPEQAAAAVLELSADPQRARRLADAAGRRLTDRFEIRQMVRDLEQSYLSLLSSESTPESSPAAARGRAAP